MKRRLQISLFIPVWLGLLAATASAQTAITAITTTSSDLANTNTNGVTFENSTLAVSTFTSAAGNTYTFSGTGVAAYARRNGVNANQSSVWYMQGSPTTEFRAPYSTNYSSLLLGNNLYRGSDNTFANGSGAQDGNIERLDFVLSTSGTAATTDMAFAIFDRGAINVHDQVKIALITGWDSVNNKPTAYAGNLISITSANYGTANVVGNGAYNLFRYGNGDNLGSPSYWNSNSETGTQGIGGVVVTLADLGIAAGTTIYGYSLFGNDVTNGGNMSNLVDWSNAAYYPTSTSNATGTGGIDLAAVNGVMFRRYPEPSTYGATLLGAGFAIFGLRRWRSTHGKAAAR